MIRECANLRESSCLLASSAHFQESKRHWPQMKVFPLVEFLLQLHLIIYFKKLCRNLIIFKNSMKVGYENFLTGNRRQYVIRVIYTTWLVYPQQVGIAPFWSANFWRHLVAFLLQAVKSIFQEVAYRIIPEICRKWQQT